MYLARLPTDYGVLTRLGEDEVAKPATTVHIVSEYIMEITFKSRINRDQGQQSTYFIKTSSKKLSPVDIASTKIRKVTKLCRKNLPRLCQIVAGDGNFNNKKYSF